MKRISLFTVLLGVIPYILTAQSIYSDFIPPSPNAASLGKYGESTIGYFTGTAQVDIPLWTIKGKDISVPISLSYSATGVKVEDVPSWCGLGWTLNAGGVITRSIRDVAEYPASDGTFPNRKEVDLKYPSPEPSDFQELQNLTSNALNDSEPDIFYYNFCGRAGKFFFDGSGNAITGLSEDIKIEFDYVSGNYGDNNRFIITTEKGNKYYFEAMEETSSFSQPFEISAWYLTRVTNANETEEVLLTYEDEYYSYHNAKRGIDLYYPAGVGASSGILKVNPGEFSSDYTYLLKECRENIVKGKRLESITSNFMGTIEFIPADINRKDVVTDNSFALKEILVKNLDGENIKKFSLTTSFRESNVPYINSAPNCVITGSDANYMNYRLYLDGVDEISTIGSTQDLYEFQYYGRLSNGKDGLPSRLSAAQDWHGFYNGQNDNESLVPEFIGRLDFSLDQSNVCMENRFYEDRDVNIQGADRGPSISYAKYGTLKSIRYPTGGISEYYFESHKDEFNNIMCGIRIDSIVNNDGSGNKIVKRYDYGQGKKSYDLYFFDETFYSRRFQFVTLFLYCERDGTGDFEYRPALIVSSGPFNDLGNFGGPQIGYSNVDEIEVGNGFMRYIYNTDVYEHNNGYEIRYLAYNPGWTWLPQGVASGRYFVQNDMTWPFGSINSNNFKFGTLEQIIKFDNHGNRVFDEQYDYEYSEINLAKGLKTKTLTPDEKYVYYEYEIKSGWKKLNEKITRTYNSGNQFITSETFTYGADHVQPIEIESLNSKRETVTTKLRYPHDFEDGSNIYHDMVIKNMISPVIEKKKQVNGVHIQAEKTNYSSYGASSLILPYSIDKGIDGTDYEQRVRFLNYDNKGNLLWASKDGGPDISYIWGYDQTYPIAKITNANQDKIAYTSFENGPNEGHWVFSAGSTDCEATCGSSCISSANSECTTICDSGCNGDPDCISSCMSGCVPATYTGCYNDCLSNCTDAQPILYGEAKTGSWSYKGSTITRYDLPTGRYVISFWAKKTGSSNGTIVLEGSAKPISSSNWAYHAYVMDLSGDLNINLGGVLIDELRLHPIDAQMTTYTYDPLIGMTSATDENGQPTIYKYDPFGRLETVKDSDGNILSDYEYHFKSQQ